MSRATRGLILLIVIALIMPACMKSGAFFGDPTPQTEQVLRFWNATEPSSLDPHKPESQTELNILMNIFEMLTSYDPKTLEPLPGVAESWEAREQARAWVFHLRKN